MDFLKHNLLTILIFLPTVGAILTMFVRGRDKVRWMALGTTIVTFALSLLLFATFKWAPPATGSSTYAYEQDGGTVQMVQQASWIPAFNVQYKVGIDGLSFPLVILSTGYPTEEALRKALQLRVDYLLMRPAEAEEMTRFLHRELARRESLRER